MTANEDTQMPLGFLLVCALTRSCAAAPNNAVLGCSDARATRT